MATTLPRTTVSHATCNTPLKLVGEAVAMPSTPPSPPNRNGIAVAIRNPAFLTLACLWQFRAADVRQPYG